MRVLLLGGTGFIGTATARALRSAGHDVTTVGRGPSADRRSDISDIDAIADLLGSEPSEVVINLLGAGLSGSADTAQMTAVNTTIPARLPELIANAPSSARLVHAASSTERLPGHTDDESEYSRTKHEGSQALAHAALEVGLPTTILSIHNTYGPGQPQQRFVANVIHQLRAGNRIELRYPDRIRDFVLIDDVAACLVTAAQGEPATVDFAEAGTGTGTSLRDLSLRIADMVGADPALVHDNPVVGIDPNPTTVARERHGTYALCTTDLHQGLLMTTQED